MRKTFHIIGAGFAGLTCAYALAKKGHKVIVCYDSNDSWAATPAAHGISTIKGLLESQTELFDMKMRGHNGFETFLSELETFVGQTRPAGVWRREVKETFHTAQEFKQDFRRIFRRQFLGPHRVSINFDAKEYYAECIYYGDWWVEPDYYISLLKQACNKLNVEFFDAPIEPILYDAKADSYLFNQADHIHAAKNLLVCAGAKTQNLLLKINYSFDQTFAVSGYTFKARTPFADLCIVKGKTGITMSNGCLYLGSSSDAAVPIHPNLDVSKDPKPAKVFFANLLENIFRKIPKNIVAENTCEEFWGVRVRTKNRAPLFRTIIANQSSSITVNFGYYKSGIILSWLLADEFARQQ